MYQRIKDELDVALVADELLGTEERDVVLKRVREIISTLDSSYGCERSSHAMGGYVLLFRDSETYRNEIDKICSYYHFAIDEYEYSDVLNEEHSNSLKWYEELYLLSSDDSLVLIHPR